MGSTYWSPWTEKYVCAKMRICERAACSSPLMQNQKPSHSSAMPQDSRTASAHLFLDCCFDYGGGELTLPHLKIKNN